MKKRILALALAGTTAFSVFGAALSANAAYYPSTDIDSEVDAYVSYTPVADTITATVPATPDKETTYEYYNLTDSEWKTTTDKEELDDYLETVWEIQSNYYTMKPCAVDGSTVYYITGDYKKIIGVKSDYSSGSVVDLDDSLLGSCLDITKDDSGDYVVKGIYATGSSGDLKAYDTKEEAISAAIEKNADSLKAYSAVLYIHKTANNAPRYQNSDDLKARAPYKDFDDYIDNSKYVHVTDTTPEMGNNYDVTVIPTIDSNNTYENWSFNANMDGDITVYPFEVTSTLKQDGNVIYIESTKESVETVYAFDFIYNNPEIVATPSSIADAWTKKDEATLASLLAGNVEGNDLKAEHGAGQAGRGIRYDVVSDWEDFLDELSLDKYWLGYGLGEYGFDEFCDNYKDMFYYDPQFDVATGILDYYHKVDLYNIEGLLKDIWELRTAEKWELGGSTGYYNANTSELIYLMQQYDKYIGNYIDKTEVASDDWGDLLLSILDAATEEDFTNASEYRRYTNTVEDLRTAYETATTTTLIKKAEWNMYALLTSGNTKYSASKTTAVDKAALGDTLNGLYFNVGSAPDTYSVQASTTDTNNVKYSNYNYYVAALSGKYGITDDNTTLKFTSSLKKGYYSLYPMADYMDYDTSTPNEVYAGNAVADTDPYKGNLATEEYEWFWNVYQLAAKMNASGSGSSGNTKQGSVDAVNDALADAVAELAVMTTPKSIELGAVEDALEEYAGKIESDYDEGYYAKYVQANDYAENVAEGLWQTRIAAMIAGVAGEALTYQGTQVTVTKNDMKTVETAIKNGKTALEAIKADKDYNAAQVNALNKAIDEAEYLVSLYEGTVSRNNPDVQSVNHVYSKLVGDKDQMVKSDLTNAIEAIDAAINYSEIIMGWSKNDAGKWQYGTEEGYLNDGWHQVDGGKTWYYFTSDGTAMQSDWLKENGKWYWLNSNCGAAYGWAKVDGKWYYFNGDNSMRTGWVKVEGNWYYLSSSGAMVTGWCEVDGKWYYFSKKENALGQMEYNTTIDGYKLGADGAWIK